MSKKLIVILSVVGLLAITGGTVGVFLLLRGNPAQDNTAPISYQQPGETVATSDKPDYKACAIISTNGIRSSLGAHAVSLASSAQTTAVFALNGEVADQCVYQFSTALSSDNTLSIQAYLHTAKVSDNPNLIDPIGNEKWLYIADTFDIEGTVLFNQSTANGQLIYHLVVIGLVRDYLFTVTQPADKAAIIDEQSHIVMAALANAADYKAALTAPSDAAPVPVDPPESS